MASSSPATPNQRDAAAVGPEGSGADVAGLTEPWQGALILPTSYEDFSTANTSEANGFDVGKRVVVTGVVRGQRRTRFPDQKGKPPRTSLNLELADGTMLRLVWFGDVREQLRAADDGAELTVAGELRSFEGAWEITGPTVVEKQWLGRSRPTYPATAKGIAPDVTRTKMKRLVREYVIEASRQLLLRIPGGLSEDKVLKAIKAPADIDCLARLIIRAHYPQTPQDGYAALEALDRLAAWLVIDRVLADRHKAAPREPLLLDLERQMGRFPVTLTPDQRAACLRMEQVFGGDRARSMLVTGDVGSGKTFTYLALVAAVAAASGRSAILLPNGPLAGQVARDARTIFPDLKVALVTQESSDADPREAEVVIGTTALLHRDVGPIDLMVCDEQHKLGAAQRRALCGPTTHTLDVTATPIPRSLALARYGAVETYHIRTGHAAKDICTRIWKTEQRRDLFEAIKHTVKAKERILVIYPTIDSKRKGGGRQALMSIEDAEARWTKAYPGQVRLLFGRMTEDEKRTRIDDLVTGAASIGVCTSLVEVGINIPNLRRVVIVHPERFGLTALHQLRGRLAREGGHGAFDLMLSGEVSEKSLERLQVLVETTDGLEVAKADLRLRGPGEITAAGERQSGAIDNILPGRELNLDYLESMVRVAERARALANTKETPE